MLSDIPDFVPVPVSTDHFQGAALDTLDYSVLDAAVFHAQPTSEARVVNFAQIGPPLLAAFRLDV
ncbi:MAG TPA: hypothetical protein VKC60_09920 [Opitutaceae bacterium]|nr:hypothetical protein [Opitutaceae bacterium]